MPIYRTSSLFHYTSSIDKLQSILLKGLIPNYCKEDLSTSRNPQDCIGIPMVSFCDIPLTRTTQFTSRYGNYAIGLSKEWALLKKVNPILYIEDENILSSLKFYKNFEGFLKDRIEKRGGTTESMPISLTLGEHPEIADFFHYHSTHSANMIINGFIKKYTGSHNGVEQVNYEENEWRYVVSENGDTPWMWSADEYEKWRGVNKNKPEPSDKMKEHRILFEVKDITHLLVHRDSDIETMINYIEKQIYVSQDYELSHEDKCLLYSKLISMERIGKDF